LGGVREGSSASAIAKALPALCAAVKLHFPAALPHLLPIELISTQEEILSIATVEHNLKDTGISRLKPKARSIKARDDSAVNAAGGRP